MKPAAIPPDEPARLEALHRYEILDTLPEQVYDDLTRLAAFVCDAPISLVSLVDSDRLWFKAKTGLDITEVPRDLAFCAHASRLDQDLLVVPDASLDERFKDHPMVVDTPNIRFYVATPLVSPSGHALGTLCVIDRKPRELKPDQLNMLCALGRQVVSQLELRLSLIHQKRAEEVSRRAMKEAKDANEAKSTFLANGEHLLDLINDVLDLSKIAAGLEPIRCDRMRFKERTQQLDRQCVALRRARHRRPASRRGAREPDSSPNRRDRLRYRHLTANHGKNLRVLRASR